MFLLQYDPYSQTAEVRNLKSDGTATDFDNIYKKDADTLRILEKDIILQNRIEALISVLKNISATKIVDIRFVGTKKDYQDLEEGIKRLKAQGLLDSGSRLEKAETPFFHEPNYIREQLHEISEDVSRSVEHLRAEYPETSEQLQFDDAGFKDVLNERTPLVLVGSGSHGKSSVINALIGGEVLQTGNGTTTEAVYEIIPDENNIQLVFNAIGNRFAFDFNGSKEEAERQLNSVFPEEKTSLATDNPYNWVYQAVALINKHGGASEVSIHVPFKNLKNISNQVVIYDTPGPDSMTRTGHKGILNQALNKFKKGVVIFVTTPNEIEKVNLRSFLRTFTDNEEELLSVLNVNASIIVINQSDTSDIQSIRDGKESRERHLKAVTDSDVLLDFIHEQDRIVYFSSAFALSICKSINDVWEASSLRKAARVTHYMVPELDDDDKKAEYLPLATEAELPPLRKDYIIKAYKEAERRYNSDRSEENQRELIAHNSGLRALEYEIGFVVNELSICNMCAQGQKHLEAVLSKATDCLASIRQNIEALENDKRDEFDDIYGNILKKLFGEEDEEESVLSKEKKAVKKHVADSIAANEEGEAISNALSKMEADIKRDINWNGIWKKRDQEITDKVAETIIKSTEAIQNKRNADAAKYYQDRFLGFKAECQKVIDEEGSLSEEEKRLFLKDWEAIQIEKAYVTIERGKLRISILGIFELPDPISARKEAVKMARDVISNQKQKTWKQVENWFEESCKNATETLYTKEWITSRHPRLRELSDEVGQLTKQSKEYEELLDKVKKNLEIVRSLTIRQEKGKQ